MLKRTRQILAALFFAGITLLLLDVSGTLFHYLSWMPKVQLLPALLAANLTDREQKALYRVYGTDETAALTLAPHELVRK